MIESEHKKNKVERNEEILRKIRNRIMRNLDHNPHKLICMVIVIYSIDSFFTVINLKHIHTAVQIKCIYNTAHLSI